MSGSTSSSSKVFQNQDDVHISYEDQEKINRFANHNARMDELKIEVDQKKIEMKNMEEAMEELELCDEAEQIPFLFGEVFLSHDVCRTHELLKTSLENLRNELTVTQREVNRIQSIMNELKSQLYERFGSNISLENENE